MEEKKALVICDYSIKRHPSAENAIMYAKILRDLGYTVQVVGFDAAANCDESSSRNEIDCVNLSIMLHTVKNRGFIKRRIIKRHKLLNAIRAMDHLNLYIYMGEYVGQVYHLICREAKKQKAKIICQVCEWYDRKKIYVGCKTLRQYIEGTVHYIGVEFARRWGFIKNKNILVVSSYLMKYYTKKGCNCITVPNLLEIPNQIIFDNKTASDPLKLGYFGTPGLHNCKDSLLNVILGIRLLGKELYSKLEFHIFGPTKEDLLNKYDIPMPILAELSNCVFAHGEIEQMAVRKNLINYDFTVLLRENTRSNNCGLSSKAGESLANGVPMICNLTSDMGSFIIDGVSGLVCQDESPESFAETVKRALLLSKDDIVKLRHNSYNIGKEKFNYKNYIQQFELFLKLINVK